MDGETSQEGDLGSVDTGNASGDEGVYEDPGGYSTPEGTTGYSGLTSDEPEPPEEGSDYPASVGAALAVVGGIIELGGGALAAGSTAAKLIDGSLFGIFRLAEGLDLVYGD